MKNQEFIQVYLNKWLYLDENGNPATRLMLDPSEGGRGYIGAAINPETKAIVFVDGPVKVRATKYTRERISKGELIVADAKTASSLGVELGNPLAKLEEAKAKAIASFDAQHGVGAWLELHPEPAKEDLTSADASKKSRKTSNATE
jgi:hypothetical protein